jgi:hypothetical protein
LEYSLSDSSRTFETGSAAIVVPFVVQPRGVAARFVTDEWSSEVTATPRVGVGLAVDSEFVSPESFIPVHISVDNYGSEAFSGVVKLSIGDESGPVVSANVAPNATVALEAVVGPAHLSTSHGGGSGGGTIKAELFAQGGVTPLAWAFKNVLNDPTMLDATLAASASEAGATVNRITPFSAANWDERALKSGQPVFKWGTALGVTSIQVKDMDKPGQPVIWQGPAPATGWVAWPPKTAALGPGEPYKVEGLASGGTVVANALFSIDPALDVADNLANRVVPLSKP